jgi:hypothetical protein
VASKKSQHIEVGEVIPKAREMYSLSIQADWTIDRRDSTRSPLFLGVRSELLLRTGGGSKHHGDNWGDAHTPPCRVFLLISRFRFSLLRRVPLPRLHTPAPVPLAIGVGPSVVGLPRGTLG